MCNCLALTCRKDMSKGRTIVVLSWRKGDKFESEKGTKLYFIVFSGLHLSASTIRKGVVTQISHHTFLCVGMKHVSTFRSISIIKQHAPKAELVSPQ